VCYSEYNVLFRENLEKKMGKYQRFFKLVTAAAVIFSALIAQSVFAANDPLSLGGVASQVTSSFGAVAKFMTASFYLLGLGFMGSAIFKFRAHKDNPTQIPVGTPIALTFIGAAFLFTPSLFGTAGTTLFGSDASSAGVGGVSSF
jgi:intracellular multiplication protein IcmD